MVVFRQPPEIIIIYNQPTSGLWMEGEWVIHLSRIIKEYSANLCRGDRIRPHKEGRFHPSDSIDLRPNSCKSKTFPSNFCRGDRIRTCDPRFWRPMLYQLSYSPIRHHRHSRCWLKSAQTKTSDTNRLFRFLVRNMLAAKPAKLLDFKFPRRLCLILCCRIVTALTACAL